jgi:hypothetical protein
MAALWWPRARQSSALLLSACVMEVLLIVAAALVSGWYVPHAIRDNGAVAIRQTVMIWGVANSLLHAIVYGLLIWAVFAGRGHAATATR